MLNFKKKNSPGRSGKFISVTGEETPFAYVEAFKSLRTNIGFLTNVNDVRCILVTSAVPAESKSTTAINLAITLADGGNRVALVECDMRKPVLRKYLKRELGQAGLAAFLAGLAELDDCIVELEDLGISAIGAGVVPPNPSELLNTPRMEALIAMLRRNYDYIILDAPPVTVVTDASIVGRFSDGALLVVRSKFASSYTVRQAKAKLENLGIRILGGVLTRFQIRKNGWSNNYDYQNYQYGYGSRKGSR